MGKKLDQYKGNLTPSQIAEGINAASHNAKRLVEDATILLNAKRFASAASLAILSIEESGKASILRGLALAVEDKEIILCWKNYRSHTKKNVSWLLPRLALDGARKLEDFRPLFEEGAEHPHILDQVKQLGFYTDCLGKSHWTQPEEVIDERLAQSLTQIAKISCCKQVTAKEIELWVKHLGAAQNGDFEAQKKALANWYAEMQETGLKPQGKNEMEEFINQGVVFPCTK